MQHGTADLGVGLGEAVLDLLIVQLTPVDRQPLPHMIAIQHQTLLAGTADQRYAELGLQFARSLLPLVGQRLVVDHGDQRLTAQRGEEFDLK